MLSELEAQLRQGDHRPVGVVASQAKVAARVAAACSSPAAPE